MTATNIHIIFFIVSTINIASNYLLTFYFSRKIEEIQETAISIESRTYTDTSKIYIENSGRDVCMFPTLIPPYKNAHPHDTNALVRGDGSSSVEPECSILN